MNRRQRKLKFGIRSGEKLKRIEKLGGLTRRRKEERKRRCERVFEEGINCNTEKRQLNEGLGMGRICKERCNR